MEVFIAAQRELALSEAKELYETGHAWRPPLQLADDASVNGWAAALVALPSPTSTAPQHDRNCDKAQLGHALKGFMDATEISIQFRIQHTVSHLLRLRDEGHASALQLEGLAIEADLLPTDPDSLPHQLFRSAAADLIRSLDTALFPDPREQVLDTLAGIAFAASPTSRIAAAPILASRVFNLSRGIRRFLPPRGKFLPRIGLAVRTLEKSCHSAILTTKTLRCEHFLPRRH